MKPMNNTKNKLNSRKNKLNSKKVGFSDNVKCKGICLETSYLGKIEIFLSKVL